MSGHTPGPWGWQKFGDEWMLVGQHGQRPVVLSIRRSGPVKERGFTSLVGGRLVPFDANHPDARQLAAAPDLYETVKKAASTFHDFAEALDLLHHEIAANAARFAEHAMLTALAKAEGREP